MATEDMAEFYDMATGETSEQITDPVNLRAIVATFTASALGGAFLYSLFSRFSGTKKVLPLGDFQEFPLIRKEVLSHDTCRFTFGFPKPNMLLGLPVGQHLSLKFTDPKTGKSVIRSYTPVDDATPGEVSLVIKVYRPAPPKFPDGGLMSQHLDSLKIGDTILMKGPKGHMEWYMSGHKFGSFHVKPLGKPAEERYCEQIGMMAGGTGITPMLQVLQAIFHHGKQSNVCVKLIYANQTEDDILVRNELEALEKEFPERFSLHYTVDRPPAGKEWKHSVGFINPEMVEKHLLFGNNKPTQFMMCKFRGVVATKYS